jgi:hypothetical protein
VAGADDSLLRRGDSVSVTRDNVILEFGMFLGSLGRDRTFLVMPDDATVQLPSDLKGVIYERWISRRRSDPADALRATAGRLARTMLRSLTTGNSDEASKPEYPTPDFLTRDQLPGLEGVLAAAQRELIVLGNDCKAVVETCSGSLHQALNRGVQVKVLCVDPSHEALPAMLARVDKRFNRPEDFVQSMAGVTYVLQNLAHQYAGAFEYRLLQVLPSMGFLGVDPHDGGTLKVELYTPKPWMPIDSRPHLYIPRDHHWRPNFLQVWSSYWEGARRPEASQPPSDHQG